MLGSAGPMGFWPRQLRNDSSFLLLIIPLTMHVSHCLLRMTEKLPHNTLFSQNTEPPSAATLFQVSSATNTLLPPFCPQHFTCLKHSAAPHLLCLSSSAQNSLLLFSCPPRLTCPKYNAAPHLQLDISHPHPSTAMRPHRHPGVSPLGCCLSRLMWQPSPICLYSKFNVSFVSLYNHTN